MQIRTLSIALAFAFLRQLGHAQGTAFTYQGRLNDGAALANGNYDLRFAIYDASGGGAQQGGLLTNAATAVSNGLFTVTLDFGNGVFPGADRWLEIGVRTNGGGAFSLLAPRQALTATPYAVQAANATSVTGSIAANQITGTLAPANIAAGTINSTMLAAGSVTSNALAAGAVTTGALANGAVTATKVATVTNWFALTIANPTPASSDYFGYSVAGLGSARVLIGAYQDDTGATNAGAAYLFNTNGTLLTTFTNPTPANSDFFGTSVAGLGNDRVLIGADGDDTGASGAGAAYLFSTNGTLLTTFTNPTPASGYYFGFAVAGLGSARVLIGAMGADTGAADAGATYLFSTNGTLLTTFTNPTPANSEFFGRSVAGLGSGRVLIGAYGDDTGAGAAYLFSTNGTLLTAFTNPAPASGDFFGFAVAGLGSDRVLIGAYLDDTGGSAAGAAYLFSTNGTLLTTFTNPTPAITDVFGISVAGLGSDRVLIGAYLDDTGAADAGAAYLFSTNGTLLATFTNPTPANSEFFGASVAGLGNDRVLIGAYGDDTAASSAGAAYLFSTETYSDGLVADAVSARSITTASLEDGAVTAVKIGGVLLASQIPNLDASKITGTLADARLSANVALLNDSQTFTGTNTFGGVTIANNGNNIIHGTFTGHGVNLTNLNASQLSTGTLADAQLSANVALLNNSQTFTGTNTLAGVTIANNGNNIIHGAFTGHGGGLTNLPATNLVGTISDARLSPNIPRLNGTNAFTGTNTFSKVINSTLNAGAATTVSIGERWRDNAIVAWAKVAADGATGTFEFGVNTVTNNSTGLYTITLDDAFAASGTLIPLAIAELDNAPTNAATVRIVSVNQLAANQFQVFINNGNYSLTNNDFTFIVTGR